jgi:hypothetical protein
MSLHRRLKALEVRASDSELASYSDAEMEELLADTVSAMDAPEEVKVAVAAREWGTVVKMLGTDA